MRVYVDVPTMRKNNLKLHMFCIFLLFSFKFNLVCASNIFDLDLYESVINENDCDEQLSGMISNGMLFNYLDASAKIPTGILGGNLQDLGNYHQCLSINREVNELSYEGKYCMIKIDLSNPINITLPTIGKIIDNEFLIEKKDVIEKTTLKLRALGMNLRPSRNESESLFLRLAYCIPKVCRLRRGVDYYLNQIPIIGVNYEEEFCRLPNDKPITTADITAMVVYGVLISLCIGSTTYDVLQQRYWKRDKKTINVYYQCFSIYTNCDSLFKVVKTKDTIQCVDGVRVISMLWVVIGHSYLLSINLYVNMIYVVTEWLPNIWNLWLVAAPLAVDTFITVSGIVVVYTVLNKFQMKSFVKFIPLYILNRYLRIVPLLAATILLQTSLVNHISDGPLWSDQTGEAVRFCRQDWWYNLLFIQNFSNDLTNMCLGQSWYLAIDMQLYLIAPIVIVWLFRSERQGLIASISGFLLSLASCAAISYILNLPPSLALASDIESLNNFMNWYYIFPVSRSPPFFLGMFFGYLLHLNRSKKVILNAFTLLLLWILAMASMSLAFFIIYPTNLADHDNQMLDNFINAFSRTFWAFGICWTIFACHCGYGGPINWFLSLNMWNVPSRISYAVFLIHYPIQYAVYGSWSTLIHFSNAGGIYRFLADLSLTIFAALALMMLVDSPCNTLQKQLMSKVTSRRPPKEVLPKKPNGVEKLDP